MKSDQQPLFELLAFLDLKRIHYSLLRTRPDSIGILITLVGMRIEIFVFNDGHLEYSTFEGTEDVLSERSELLRLLSALGKSIGPKSGNRFSEKSDAKTKN
ncbi:hypothetical protein BJF92_22770 [Rhizobium rhizosphaerae]|uniref:Uncharacterized protein n=1 Tax=Xaviernesmea rhizosphaerae TaxID=1672749 RepID=A0A1Q9AJC0_9HYPH|nr:hypothetical protein [Xaviernesmea rhizosphaerae]OLP55376.1 hypothetical protein BJF92_22770 [Xaviernesmea rhizosphaerae]